MSWYLEFMEIGRERSLAIGVSLTVTKLKRVSSAQSVTFFRAERRAPISGGDWGIERRFPSDVKPGNGLLAGREMAAQIYL